MRRLRPYACLLLATLWLTLLPAWAAPQTAEPAQARPAPRADQSRDRVPPPTAARGGEVDADWILHRLTRPPPQSTPFVELRLSATLRRPLVVSG